MIILIFGSYLAYLQVNYNRIQDNTPVHVYHEVTDNVPKYLEVGKEYGVLTFNIGFGAYDHNFSFFMDKGSYKNGTNTVGIFSKAESINATLDNTKSCIDTVMKMNPDIVNFQEVDVEADRSYNVNQRNMIVDSIKNKYDDIYWTHATNFHTSYLFYPPTNPIGSIKDSGILTLSKYCINDSVRRSLPLDENFVDKFFDLDRCFTINRLPVNDGENNLKELIWINIHASAYDEGGTIRKKQTEMLLDIMSKEYREGNYVIAGGDFNQELGDSSNKFLSEMNQGKLCPFDESKMPMGLKVMISNNSNEIASNRDASIPYTHGVNYIRIIDGFIASDNVKGLSKNVDADFVGSDHNPIFMKFELV
ncbi:MAG: endonuclease/exonuclease/phosphatase family protein [Methanobrevibacter sp.]|nr:endonuclease/exonuclease/phosphatase family protein [Candidatus Methanovirga aequatorialis]